MPSPRVDIVIPVYNGAEFIAECLSSVLRQNYGDWHATVINNCSTDRTGEIADTFAQRDPRIRVVHCTEFVDQCGNYNRALSHASADAVYVKILEADNWLMDDAVAKMVEFAEKNPRVGIVGSYWLRGPRVDGWGLDPLRSVLTGREAFRLYYLSRVYLFGTPTTLLFRAAAIREQTILFRPGLFYDDLEFCARLLKKWDLGFIHQVFAYVRDDNGGLFTEVRGLDYEVAFRHFLCREYGTDWFDAKELESFRKQCENKYLRHIGFAMFIRRRGQAYWKFHQALFRSNGASLGKRDLIVPMLTGLRDRLLRRKLRSPSE